MIYTQIINATKHSVMDLVTHTHNMKDLCKILCTLPKEE